MALGLSLSPVDVLSCEFHRLVPVGARQAVAAPPAPPTHLETHVWPQSGLWTSRLPGSGEETESSSPFYGKVLSG